VPNFVSFAASIAELVNVEKSHTQSPSIFDARELKLALQKTAATCPMYIIQQTLYIFIVTKGCFILD